MKYTKKTKLSELMKDKRAVEILMSKGIYCFGCPMAMSETIEEGCLAHGIDPEKILEELNKSKKKQKIGEAKC